MIMSHKESKVFKKDGRLVVQFTFTKGSTMLETERQIESLIDSIGDSVSESEKQCVKTQLLEAVKQESRRQ